MKKKILALCLVVVLAVTAVTGATLAYFTDTDEAENIFVVGNVKIRQDEHQRDEKTKEIEDFEDNKNVMPATPDLTPKEDITVDGYNFQIRSQEGNYVDKIVNVVNEGTEEAYVRTIIAIPSMNGFDDDADARYNPLHWNFLDSTDFEGGWDWDNDKNTENILQHCYAQDVEIDGVKYDIYVATHRDPVASKATTSPSMVGFYLDFNVGYGNIKDEEGKETDEVGYFQEFTTEEGEYVYRDLTEWMVPGDDGKVTMKILVATQACQTDGFADAWEALDECFDPITDENHPWAE